VAVVVVARTQHRDRDFLNGFVFVAAAVVAQAQHTEQPLIHHIIRPDCFVFGWVCFCGSSSGSADTTHRHRFFGWVCFCGVWRTKCGGEFLTVDGVLLGERHAS